jgi:hypothetical protein
MLFYNFKDVLLHIPADCQKAYRVQLAVFRRHRCQSQYEGQQSTFNSLGSNRNLPLVKLLPSHLNKVEEEQKEPISSSSDSEEEEEGSSNCYGASLPSTSISDCWGVGKNVHTFVLKDSKFRGDEKKKLIHKSPKAKKGHVEAATTNKKLDTNIKQNKKNLMETLRKLYYYEENGPTPNKSSSLSKNNNEIIIIENPSTTAATKWKKEEKKVNFFVYYKNSEYPLGPNGVQVRQTDDQRQYYASLIQSSSNRK